MSFLAYRFISRLVLAIVLACLSACTGNASISEETIRDFLPPDEIRDQRRTPDYYYLKLPEDQSADTSRSLQNFSFANLLATELKLELKLYDLRGISDRQLAEYKANGQQHLLLAQEPVNATVILRNMRENRPIFMGKTDDHGRLLVKLALQPAFDTCVLEIIRQGAAKKSMNIEAATQFSTLNRTVALVETDATAETEVYPDSDGDFIPDVYDAFPHDAARAFQYDVPVIRFLTVAFEDNFPALGDGDFNDFVARYYVTKIANAENKVIEIQGVAEAVARAAGYDHRFGLVINFPGSTAQVSLRYNNHNGVPQSTSQYTATNSANLILFERTKQAFTRLNSGSGVDNGYNDRPRSNGHSTNFTISFANPVEASNLDEAPYDPYIFVHNTGYDIHLMGRPALTGTNNPQGSSFRDANGYPRALLVPIDWAHPLEGIFIENAYLRFLPWRSSFGMTDTDWYLERQNSLVVLQDFFATSQIRNEYRGQAAIGSEAIILDIKTNGQIRYLNSANPAYIYNGNYTYDGTTRLMQISITSVDQIDSGCQAEPCLVLANYPATMFFINPAFQEVRINGIFENALSATLVHTNSAIMFYRRNGFGPFDE